MQFPDCAKVASERAMKLQPGAIQMMMPSVLRGCALVIALPTRSTDGSGAMKHITVYLDFISPYAYLAFVRLPVVLEGISYSVTYRPVLFAGLLEHHGQLGPAEIACKRTWTYRQALWLAHSMGIAMQMPATHPFNPLPLLRLAVACAGEVAAGVKSAGPIAVLSPVPSGEANRQVCETIFNHVWRSGLEAGDAKRLDALALALRPAHEVNCPAVKKSLQRNTDDAIAQGIFGVPTFVVDDKIFWGLDALPMLRDYLCGDPWFAGDGWQSVENICIGAARK